MKKSIAIFCILAICILGCNQAEKYYSQLLSSEKLPSQFYTINTSKDTTLITSKGAVIKIPKGAISGDAETVQLEIKEAYSIEDIFRAGLTTQSNGQPLSSGGMIYINAVKGTTATLKQKISIAIPTKKLNSDMKLFKGEKIEGDRINWTNPVALPDNPQLKALEQGKALFINNCASCHAIGKVVTGPDLAHMVKRSKIIAKRESKNNFEHNLLYDYTRNPYKPNSSRHYTAINCFSPTSMSSFEQLTDRDLDNLYSYIQNESELRNLPIPDYSFETCFDSCIIYQRTKDSLQGIHSRLSEMTVDMVNEIRKYDSTTAVLNATNFDTVDFDNTNSTSTLPVPDIVQPIANQSLYYQFTIESFDWYNIDILLKDYSRCVPSELIVTVKGEYKEKINLYLVIPSIKALLPGGPLKNLQDSYGFYEKDGSIPLPMDSKAYIIVMGEYEDKLVFGQMDFFTSRKLSFQIELNLISKEEFNTKMNSLKFDNLSMSVADTKVAEPLRKVIKDLKSVELLKPKGCDCNCVNITVGRTMPAADEAAVDSLNK